MNWDATDNDVEQLLNGSSSKVWLTLDLSTEHPGQLYKVCPLAFLSLSQHTVTVLHALACVCSDLSISFTALHAFLSAAFQP